MQVDSQTATVDGGASTTVTLSWTTSSSNPDDTGAYEATAASPTSSDTELFTVGSRDLARFVTGFTPGGAGSVSRTATATRSVTATTPGGAGTVTRTATINRNALGVGRGAGSVSWLAPDAWALPTAPGSGVDVLFTPSAASTTYDELSLSGRISEAKREALSHYRRAGDVDRKTGAFGTFRRIRRDGDDLLTVRPPATDSPPYGDRRVAPVSMDAQQWAPGLSDVTLTLGLEEPRAREPIEAGAETFRADAQDVTVDGGATEQATLSWTPDGTQLGDWQVNVTSGSSSDSQLVTVSDAPWTFSWPVATLALTERRVGQVERSSDAGVPAVTLPIRLDAAQVATILAVGARVEAAEARIVPDAGNTIVDTLPDDELTCGLGTPAGSSIADGAYVLRDWSVERARPAPPAYDATVTLVRDD